MSLVVVNVSAGSAVVTLPSISSVPGRILTVKDNGSASATNIATLTPTSGDTFESGVATYLLNTPFAYVTFIGNGATLKWRVLDSTYPDIPINIPPIIPSPGTLGGVTGTLTNLTVSGPTLLGNSSNTGNLGVAGTATISTLSVTGNADFSKLQVQGGLSVFSSLNAYNINFTSSITSNGLPFSSGASASSGFAQITGLPFQKSYGMCFDGSNNMYVADQTAFVIYKITPQGQTSIFAGVPGLSGTTDGYGSAATFNTIFGMFYDPCSKWIIIATANCIRAANPATGQVLTLVGNPSTAGNASSGTGTAGTFGVVTGLCSGSLATDTTGVLYATDGTYNILAKVTFSLPPTTNGGTKSFVAGSGSAAYANGTGAAAAFNNPRCVVMNSSKTLLYVSSYANVIQKITLPNVVTTLVGGAPPSAAAGHTDQAGSANSGSVTFLAPTGMVIDASDNLIITEFSGHYLRYINISAGTFNYSLTLAGNGSTGGYASGVGANGLLTSPTAVALDNTGSPWVVGFPGSGNTAIWNYNLQTGYLNLFYRSSTTVPTPGNVQNTAISTIVAPAIATGTIYGSGNTITNSNSTNPGGATYKNPQGLLMDSQNNLYVADSLKIRKVTPSGLVTSIYGDPSNSQNTMQQGIGATGQLNNIYQMSLDTSGNMYIVGISQNVIYKLNLTTYAGTSISITGQVLSSPVAVLYLNNKLYITNRGTGSYVVMVDLSTNVSTLIAGSTTTPGAANNATGTSATFNTISGACFDSTRTSMIVCDTSNNTLRTINLTSPYAVATLSFSGTLSSPVYVAIDSQYNLYVSNFSSPVGISKIPYTGSYTSPNQTYGTATGFSGGITYSEPQGLTIDSYNNLYTSDSTHKVIYYTTPSGTASVYSGVFGSLGTQDSLYASSITLMAPYVGINTANPTSALHVSGNANVTGNITTTGNVVITGSLGTSTGGFYGKLSTELWINSTDDRPRLSYTNNSHSQYRTANSHLFRNSNDSIIFTIDANGSINASGNAVVTGTLVASNGFYGKFGINQWITSVDTVPRLYCSSNSDTFFYTATNSTFYFQSPAGNVANINGNTGTYTVMSDERIKKNILITRDSLDIINQINIVSYDYIDSGRGSVKHGIVAQQLQQVYPDAVDTLRNVIPSHLTVVDFDLDSENIIIKCSTPHGLLVNDTVKLDIDNKRVDKVILEVLSDTTFVVSSWDNFSATSSVSLYGKYVNDFLSYDKSQIGILAAGACQTLSGQVSTLQSDSSNTSTITGIQFSTLQADSLNQQSTIAGLQATITSILEKYPV